MERRPSNEFAGLTISLHFPLFRPKRYEVLVHSAKVCELALQQPLCALQWERCRSRTVHDLRDRLGARAFWSRERPLPIQWPYWR